MCRERDLAVTVVERGAAPLVGALGGMIGAVAADMQREHGVDLLSDATTAVAVRHPLYEYQFLALEHWGNAEYVTHYNDHRPHQARQQLPPAAHTPPPPITDLGAALVRRRTILNGLVSEYSQLA